MFKTSTLILVWSCRIGCRESWVISLLKIFSSSSKTNHTDPVISECCLCYTSYMIRTQSPDMQSLNLIQEACALFHSTLLTYVWHKIKIHRNVFKHFFNWSCKLFRQLDDSSRSAFKENVRLNEALKHHIREAEDLQKLTASLTKENASLALDKVCLNRRTANSGVTIRHWQSLDGDHSCPRSHFQSRLLWNTCQNCAEYISGGFSLALFTCADPVYFACGPTPNPHLLTTPRLSVVSGFGEFPLEHRFRFSGFSCAGFWHWSY